MARALMGGFLSAFDRMVERAGASSILEVGCGEGELAVRMARTGATVLGTDISVRMIEQARRNAEARGVEARFRTADLFALDPSEGPFDLVVCCEVLEHLDDPEAAIRHLAGLTRSAILFSVPREPIWRLLNMARGRYWSDLGNTPGHIQHWSRRDFLQLLRRHLVVDAEPSPFPWTMALTRVPGPGAS